MQYDVYRKRAESGVMSHTYVPEGVTFEENGWQKVGFVVAPRLHMTPAEIHALPLNH